VENFQWEIYNFQNNVFRVKFPNKAEAQRMKTFRTYPVPDRGSDLVFEDWSALEDPLYMLPEVWLRVRGIPADVRTDFLSLWAVGTLFGKTKEVDMVHTRKNKELRLRIGCLDHTLIPETTDVFIQRGFFKLSIDVEPVTVIQLDSNVLGNGGGNNGGGDNNGSNGDKSDGASDMDFEKTINNEQQKNTNDQQGTKKNVNNAKSVSAHQAQHLIETPILFGSLKKDLLRSSNHVNNISCANSVDHCASPLSDENSLFSDSIPLSHVAAQNDTDYASFKVDAVLGSPNCRGTVSSGLAGAALPLGRLTAPGIQPVGADSAAAATPRATTPRALSPGRRSTPAAAARAGAATSGDRGLVANQFTNPEARSAVLLSTERLTAPASPVDCRAHSGVSSVAAVDAGFDPEGGSVCSAEPTKTREHGMPLLHGPQTSSMASHSGGCSIPSTKNTGINIVIGTENISSPTVVMRQLSGTKTPIAIGFEERAKKAILDTDVAAFGGIPVPTLSVRASDRIRAQPNADDTQLERAMQNASFRHGFTAPGKILSKPSIVSLSNEDIVAKANRLGISFGKSKNEVLKAVESIKEVEVNRTLVILKKNVENQLNKDEGQNSLLTSKLSSLTGDLLIEEKQEQWEQDDLLMPIINLKKPRRKKEFDLSGVRRSARFKTKIVS
jgi:hypothetical protein